VLRIINTHHNAVQLADSVEHTMFVRISILTLVKIGIRDKIIDKFPAIIVLVTHDYPRLIERCKKWHEICTSFAVNTSVYI
jgi:hypothetical protein